MQVNFKHFRSSMSSWDKLFRQAAEFATQVGPQRVISISHSEDQNDGVVTVWYWEQSAVPVYAPPPLSWQGQ